MVPLRKPMQHLRDGRGKATSSYLRLFILYLIFREPHNRDPNFDKHSHELSRGLARVGSGFDFWGMSTLGLGELSD